MNPKIKKGWLIPALLLFLLIISNPGSKSFKEFGGYTHYAEFKRTSNWVIFSTYMDVDSGDRYAGIFFNFYKL